MKKLIYLSSFMFILMLATSCEPDDDDVADETAKIELQIKANYGGQALVMGDNLTYVDGLPIFFTRFHFFISNVTLTDANGTVETIDAAKVDFTDANTSENGAIAGVFIRGEDVPVGNYTSMHLGIGIAPDLNATKPSDYTSEHDLSDSGDYWSGWESYIFTKIEGRADTDTDGTYDLGFVYHIGSNKQYQEMDVAVDLDLAKNEKGTVNLEIDMKKLLASSDSDFLDIRTNNAVHEDETLMKYIMDNFQTAISF